MAQADAAEAEQQVAAEEADAERVRAVAQADAAGHAANRMLRTGHQGVLPPDRASAGLPSGGVTQWWRYLGCDLGCDPESGVHFREWCALQRVVCTPEWSTL